ncbi:MAG: hypothetical protein JSV91_08015 [Phycisphaerales bacterium]|nr:MAG: hypothetical protein JSV91_08015 [Phycisphaerales bacterium]
MSSQFIVFLEPARDGMVANPTAEEAAKVQAHFEYLKSLTERGVVVLAGRTTEPPITGLVVFFASDEAAARSLMVDDPAVKAGVFKARLQPFGIALRGDRG